MTDEFEYRVRGWIINSADPDSARTVAFLEELENLYNNGWKPTTDSPIIATVVYNPGDKGGVLSWLFVYTFARPRR